MPCKNPDELRTFQSYQSRCNLCANGAGFWRQSDSSRPKESVSLVSKVFSFHLFECSHNAVFKSIFKLCRFHNVPSKKCAGFVWTETIYNRTYNLQLTSVTTLFRFQIVKVSCDTIFGCSKSQYLCQLTLGSVAKWVYIVCQEHSKFFTKKFCSCWL